MNLFIHVLGGSFLLSRDDVVLTFSPHFVWRVVNALFGQLGTWCPVGAERRPTSMDPRRAHRVTDDRHDRRTCRFHLSRWPRAPSRPIQRRDSWRPSGIYLIPRSLPFFSMDPLARRVRCLLTTRLSASPSRGDGSRDGFLGCSDDAIKIQWTGSFQILQLDSIRVLRDAYYFIATGLCCCCCCCCCCFYCVSRLV